MSSEKIIFTGMFRRDPDSDVFLAHCPELDIDTEGRDLDQAAENLEEAISLYLETAAEEGTLGDLVGRLIFRAHPQAA